MNATVTPLATNERIPVIGDLIPKPNVIQAISAVARDMPAIAKDQRSPQGYMYRGIEQVMEAASKLMAKHGVVITPCVAFDSIVPVIGMKDGWQDVRVTARWKIYGPQGKDDFIEAQTVGIGRDNSDKGSNKGHTAAKKYLMYDLFNISDAKDDVEFHEVTYTPEVPRPDVSGDMAALKTLSADDRAQVRSMLGLPDGATGTDVAHALAVDHDRLVRVRQFIATKGQN